MVFLLSVQVLENTRKNLPNGESYVVEVAREPLRGLSSLSDATVDELRFPGIESESDACCRDCAFVEPPILTRRVEL